MAKKSSKPKSQALVKPGAGGLATGNIDTHKKEVFKRGKKFVRPLAPTKKRFVSLTIAIVLGVLAIVIIVFGVLIYVFNSSSSLTYRVARIIPYPAARVNGQFISYGDYLFQLHPLTHYYQNQAVAGDNKSQAVDFSTPEGKKKLEELQQLALREAEETIIIKQLAKQNDVSVSKEELNDAVNQAIEREGGQNKFKQAIEYFYGWDVGDFRKVMKTQLLQRKLQPIYSTDERKQAEAALARVKSGQDFAVVAKEVSQDPGSKDKGGDLGFTSKGAYVPEFEKAAYSLKPGEVSGIVETQFGFHIIKVTEKKDDQIKVSHILVQYKDFQQILNQQLAQAKINDYIKVKAAGSDTKAQDPAPAQ